MFVFDFANDVNGIRESFAPYYRSTLAEETDSELHDLNAALDGYQMYCESRSISWRSCTSAAPTAAGST